MARFGLAVVLLTLAGCGGDRDSITIELEQVNGSGVSGRIALEPVGERLTRISVITVDGGEITGARVMPDTCDTNGLDDKYPITPPSGTIQVPFELIADWIEEGPLAAAFLRRGRYVACGEA
jgi:hypothetical protein